MLLREDSAMTPKARELNMAKVWMAKEGSDPTKGGPWRTMPLDECREKLDLKASNFRCDLTTIPKFGDTSDPPAMFRAEAAAGGGQRPAFTRA